MQNTRAILLTFAVGLLACSAAGQQITLNFTSLGGPYNFPAPVIGPFAGTVTSTSAASVTLSSPTSFVRFTTGSCSSASPQTLSLATTANVPAPVGLCLVGLDTGGGFLALVSAFAPGFPDASTALPVSSFPGGSIQSSVATADVSTGSKFVVFSNNYDTLSLPVKLVPSNAFAPSNAAWLVATQDTQNPCSSVTNGGSCTVTLSSNPNAPGLVPGSKYTAQVAFIGNPGGNIGAVAVTYTYNPPPLHYVPITPCRMADTRLQNGPFGGPILAAGTTRSFSPPSSSCGVPSTAQAYSINVTAVPVSGLGYMSVWPSGQTRPSVSILNSDGRVKASPAIVGSGSGGAVNVFASDDTHVILDVNGYFVDASTANSLTFYPITPCRVADTRGAVGALGGPLLSATVSRDFPILSSNCGVPSSAQAYSLNFTAIPRRSIGFLATWPTGTARPFVSTLNAPSPAVTANGGLAKAGAGGSVSVYSSDDTDLIIDINGYFATPSSSGLSLYNLAPCRVVDTRGGLGAIIGQSPVNFVTSPCRLPAAAKAYVTQVTVVPTAGGLGFLALWPEGQAQPTVSTLNSDGSITSNMALVPTFNGIISSFASNPTNLILDVSGYFAP